MLARVLIGVALAAQLIGADAARADDSYTPVVMSVMSTPRWFEGTDGRQHLVYELALTNGVDVPITVQSVSVRDVARRRTIERLSGAALTGSMSPLASPGESSTTIPGSSVGVVWLDITLPRRKPILRAVRHTVRVSVPPGLPVPATITDTGASARVDRRAPVTLGPPLRGAGWIAIGSCCDGPHRRSVQAVNGELQLGQRFAIDWNGMDAQRRFVVGDPDVNASWVFYGKPVIAVADARVVAAVDRFPDQVPNHDEPVTLEQADGNHVILDLGGDAMRCTRICGRPAYASTAAIECAEAR